MRASKRSVAVAVAVLGVAALIAALVTAYRSESARVVQPAEKTASADAASQTIRGEYLARVGDC